MMVVFTFRLVIFCIFARRFRFGRVLLYFELLYVLNIQTEFYSLFFQVRPGLSNCPKCTRQCKSKDGLTRHITVKHDENPEKEKTQKELTEEKVMSLLKDTAKKKTEQMLPLYIMCRI